MTDTADPELCSLIINVCKPSKNVDNPETEQPVRFNWFEEFPFFLYCWWEDRTYRWMFQREHAKRDLF